MRKNSLPCRHGDDNKIIRQQGFSLLEMIAVIAVMSILASAMVPNIIDGIDRAMYSAEQTNLDVLADDLLLSIDKTKKIPSQKISSWSAAIANYSDVPQAKVVLNEKRFNRVLYIDPHFFTSTNVRFKGYTQTTGLVAEPVSPRMMFISSFKSNAPSPPTSAAAFDAIWNQKSSARVKEGDDVIIKRIHLSSHFHRLILTNQRTAQTGYRIENGAQAAIPAANNGSDGSLTRYILSDSRIQLYSETYPTGSLMTTLLVNGATNFQFTSSTASGNQNSSGGGPSSGNSKKDKKKKEKKSKQKSNKKNRWNR